MSIMIMIVALSQWRHTYEKANKKSDTVVMKCWDDRLFLTIPPPHPTFCRIVVHATKPVVSFC